jgi:MFS family permease
MRFFKEAVAANSALLFGMALLTLGAGLQATLLVRRVGHIRAFAALTATAAAAILVQGVLFGAWTWTILRTVSGVCFAGIYVVAESWLNDRANQRSRGALLGSYMIVIYAGLGAGQLLLGAADPRGYVLFILIGVLISLAVVPMALTAQRAPDFALPSRVSFRELLAISPLGAAGALFSGATAGTLFSLGPVYAARSGLDTTAVATFMASSILPAIALQLPLGRLSDRVDRRSVLIGISIAAAAAALAAAQLASASLAFFVAVAAYGGLSLTTYAVCVAHINDHLHPTQMVAASATVLLANGIGSVLGPVVVAAAMELAGPNAFFASIIVLHTTFALYAAWRKRTTDSIPAPEKARFVTAPPQVAPTGRLAAPEAKPESAASAEARS